jgi:hypothetical protein
MQRLALKSLRSLLAILFRALITTPGQRRFDSIYRVLVVHTHEAELRSLSQLSIPISFALLFIRQVRLSKRAQF